MNVQPAIVDWTGKTIKKCIAAADSVKRFDDDDDDDDDDDSDDETGNPYRFDRDENRGIKKNAFNAKKFLIIDFKSL